MSGLAIDFDEDDGDEDDLDTEGCFDFPNLVAGCYANWQVLNEAIVPVHHLCLAIGLLARTLPDYVQDTADADLIEKIKAVNAALVATREAMTTAKYANAEMGQCFEELSRGFAAARAIHERAAITGFGRA